MTLYVIVSNDKIFEIYLVFFKEVIFFMVRIYIVTTSPVDFVTTCPIPHYVHFDTRDAVTKTN